MKSSIICVSEILNSAKTLTSAGFSEGYTFDEINASEHFDELVDNANYPTPIFSGILILEKKGDNCTIVDGLQRLTTISLLLCALCEIYKGTSTKNEEARKKVLQRFLLNGKNVKLDLVNKEQVIYRKLVLEEVLSDDETENNLVKTYRKFLEKIKEHKITGTMLFKIISRIQFMTIITDDSEVSVTDLYQTLNLSKDKSQVKLITDFIVRKNPIEAQTWKELVNIYKETGVPELLEHFIRDFLSIQNNGKIPHQKALYNNFKSYFAKLSAYQESAKIIENLCQYAQYYLKLHNTDFNDEEIKSQITILNQNHGQDAYPYLMEVLDDLKNSNIDEDIFVNILNMINSFILQREQNPLLGITVDFATLSKEINKMLVIKDYVPNIVDLSKLTINDINDVNKLSNFGV